MSSSSRTKVKMNNKKKNNPKNNVVVDVPSSSPSQEEEPEKQEEEEVKSTNNSNRNVPEEITESNKKSQKNKVKNEDGSTESRSFPTNRISRIIRSDVPDIRITQESVFLINKATEQFLEQFSEEVYANVAQEHKKAVHYKHVSSIVSKSKRYDFLSDFVPEKIRVEDALSERLAGI